MEPPSFILHPDDSKLLEEKNLLTFDPTAGPPSRNRRRLDRSWMFSEDSVDSAASADSGFSDKIEIPLELNSRETLLYLGFAPDTAEIIAKRWEENRDDANFPYDFIQLAVAKVRGSTADAHADVKDWAPTFQALGLTEELLLAITNSEFKHIRDTESAKFWIQDTIELRYLQLKAIQRASQKRAGNSRRAASLGGTSASGPSYSSGNQRAHAEVPAGSTGGEPAVGTTADDDNESTKDLTILWKGIARERIGWDTTGKVLAGSLRSQPPTDFSGRSNDVLYFAREREVAEDYARYARARMYEDGRSVALLRMAVPSNLLVEVFRQYYVSGDEWKKLTYLCRRGKDLDEEDMNMEYLLDKPLLIGPIAKGNNAKYEVLHSWTDLSNANKMEMPGKGSGNFATQLAFLGASTIRTLQKEADIEIDKWFKGDD